MHLLKEHQYHQNNFIYWLIMAYHLIIFSAKCSAGCPQWHLLQWVKQPVHQLETVPMLQHKPILSAKASHGELPLSPFGFVGMACSMLKPRLYASEANYKQTCPPAPVQVQLVLILRHQRLAWDWHSWQLSGERHKQILRNPLVFLVSLLQRANKPPEK